MFTFEKIKAFSLITVLLSSLFLLSGCKLNTDVTGSSSNSSSAAAQKSAVSGQVVDNLTGIPVDSALVEIIGTGVDASALTNSKGQYSFEVSLSANANMVLITSRSGYYTDTTSIYVTAGQDLSVSLLRISPKSSGQQPSGDPVSIYLASQSAASIGVKESGSEETASLTFEVQDSSGIPIDLAHSVNVTFTLGAQPNGGEIISPKVVATNESGRATVNLTSGTKAGVVQIIAQIDLNNAVIKSKPVGITIHGGLPDPNHFSLTSANTNFAGYDIFGLQNSITVYVGDKYGNPVRTGTSVYFTTTGGIIEGSSQTDNQGIGSVQLISAEPRPTDATLGAGFATITASTADENLNTISKNAVVLFSGYPVIDIIPKTFDIPNGGSQAFTYTVSDENGNPLAPGTNISVAVEGTNVGAQGEIQVTLPDTQSKSWTSFGFIVYDTADTVNVAGPVTIKLQTGGSNGGEHTSITGICR